MSPEIEKLRAGLDAATATLKAAQLHEHECIEALQGWCSHPEDRIVECDRQSMTYFDDLPKIRMCLDCFLTEHGSYFKILAPNRWCDLPIVTRDFIYEHRRGAPCSK